jgi:NAD(P)-dependent dehydrogenase (short-subunit alcohol dehydrogenase family)
MRVWFITGASRGFGALITEQALAAGDAVAATARDAASVTRHFGDHPNLLALTLDVTREAQAQAAAEAAIKRFGRIDVLVNNAGFGLLGAVEEATAQEVERVFATNVFGLLAATRAVLPHMRRQRSGHVVNMSSIGGYAASAGWGVYGATKFAVEGLTEALAIELKPLGIHVTAVEPGLFRTDFLDTRSLSVSPRSIADYQDTAGGDARACRAVQSRPAGRSGEAGEGAADAGRRARTAGAHAVRQRHGGPDRGQERIGRRGTGALARSRRVDGFRGRGVLTARVVAAHTAIVSWLGQSLPRVPARSAVTRDPGTQSAPGHSRWRARRSTTLSVSAAGSAADAVPSISATLRASCSRLNGLPSSCTPSSSRPWWTMEFSV